LGSAVGTGEAVGGIAVEVGEGMIVGVGDGLNTICSDGSGVSGGTKLQAERRIAMNI